MPFYFFIFTLLKVQHSILISVNSLVHLTGTRPFNHKQSKWRALSAPRLQLGRAVFGCSWCLSPCASRKPCSCSHRWSELAWGWRMMVEELGHCDPLANSFCSVSRLIVNLSCICWLHLQVYLYEAMNLHSLPSYLNHCTLVRQNFWLFKLACGFRRKSVGKCGFGQKKKLF